MSDNVSVRAAAIRACIEGKRVVSADGDCLTLDDGTTLRLYESDSDCCAHARGSWVISPDNLDAIITDVKITVTADREDNGDGAESRAEITILHNQNQVRWGTATPMTVTVASTSRCCRWRSACLDRIPMSSTSR